MEDLLLPPTSSNESISVDTPDGSYLDGTHYNQDADVFGECEGCVGDTSPCG
jgi:hypothetical protein